MKKISISFILILCMVFFSCSNENNFYAGNPMLSKTSHRITPEQAQQNALEFVNKVYTTRSGLKIITVSNIIPIVKNLANTRSEGDSICIDTLLYAINFEDNRGFVLASADDRTEPVIAYIEQGRFDEDDYTCLTDTVSNDSTNNSGYNIFMRNVLDIYLHDVGIYHKNIDIDIDWHGPTAMLYEFEQMKPLLKTKWGQITYNDYCDECPTGCAATAFAQICSYLEAPVNVSWSFEDITGSCVMDWDSINEICSLNDGNIGDDYDDLKDQVAHLMRYWGLQFNTRYGKEESTASVSYAISKFQQLGYNATSLEDFKVKNIVDSLKLKNCIIFMTGKNENNQGHGWVVDGYIFKKDGINKSYYLHCNWGHGGGYFCKNGYFLSTLLDDEKEPDYDDDFTTRSSHYKYSLQTSTIKK